MLIKKPTDAAGRSLDWRGAIMFARVIPAETMTREHMSTAPRKLNPYSSISKRAMGRIAAW